MTRLSTSVRASMLVALAFVSACHSWQAGDLSHGVAPLVAKQRAVRVTRRDQSREIVEVPHVEGDSLTGYGKSAGERIAVALPDVVQVEQWRRDGGRTTLTVIGSVAAFLAFNLVFSDRPPQK